jgi:hypothetical protein
MVTYQDVQPRLVEIESAVLKRQMPPRDAIKGLLESASTNVAGAVEDGARRDDARAVARARRRDAAAGCGTSVHPHDGGSADGSVGLGYRHISPVFLLSDKSFRNSSEGRVIFLS